MKAKLRGGQDEIPPRGGKKGVEEKLPHRDLHGGTWAVWGKVGKRD